MKPIASRVEVAVSGESVIGALAKEIAVLVERAEANSAISCVVHF